MKPWLSISLFFLIVVVFWELHPGAKETFRPRNDPQIKPLHHRTSDGRPTISVFSPHDHKPLPLPAHFLRKDGDTVFFQDSVPIEETPSASWVDPSLFPDPASDAGPFTIQGLFRHGEISSPQSSSTSGEVMPAFPSPIEKQAPDLIRADQREPATEKPPEAFLDSNNPLTTPDRTAPMDEPIFLEEKTYDCGDSPLFKDPSADGV